MAERHAVRPDEEIEQDVLVELEWDARVNPSEIGVTVRDGVVTLTGRVDSYLKRWAAEDAANRVWGVANITNEIEVRLPIDPAQTGAASRAQRRGTRGPAAR